MNTEKIIKADNKNGEVFITSQSSNIKSNGRVDINNLLARVRDEQKRASNIILTYFCFFAFILLLVGITLSL